MSTSMHRYGYDVLTSMYSTCKGPPIRRSYFRNLHYICVFTDYCILVPFLRFWCKLSFFLCEADGSYMTLPIRVSTTVGFESSENSKAWASVNLRFFQASCAHSFIRSPSAFLLDWISNNSAYSPANQQVITNSVFAQHKNASVSQCNSLTVSNSQMSANW
jgi:hypothetical protein